MLNAEEPAERGLDMHKHFSLCGFSVALGIVGCVQTSVAGEPVNDLRQEFEKPLNWRPSFFTGSALALTHLAESEGNRFALE